MVRPMARRVLLARLMGTCEKVLGIACFASCPACATAEGEGPADRRGAGSAERGAGDRAAGRLRDPLRAALCIAREAGRDGEEAFPARRDRSHADAKRNHRRRQPARPIRSGSRAWGRAEARAAGWRADAPPTWRRGSWLPQDAPRPPGSVSVQRPNTGPARQREPSSSSPTEPRLQGAGGTVFASATDAKKLPPHRAARTSRCTCRSATTDGSASGTAGSTDGGGFASERPGLQPVRRRRTATTRTFAVRAVPRRQRWSASTGAAPATAVAIEHHRARRLQVPQRLLPPAQRKGQRPGQQRWARGTARSRRTPRLPPRYKRFALRYPTHRPRGATNAAQAHGQARRPVSGGQQIGWGAGGGNTGPAAPATASTTTAAPRGPRGKTSNRTPTGARSHSTRPRQHVLPHRNPYERLQQGEHRPPPPPFCLPLRTSSRTPSSGSPRGRAVLRTRTSTPPLPLEVRLTPTSASTADGACSPRTLSVHRDGGDVRAFGPPPPLPSAASRAAGTTAPLHGPRRSSDALQRVLYTRWGRMIPARGPTGHHPTRGNDAPRFTATFRPLQSGEGFETTRGRMTASALLSFSRSGTRSSRGRSGAWPTTSAKRRRGRLNQSGAVLEHGRPALLSLDQPDLHRPQGQRSPDGFAHGLAPGLGHLPLGVRRWPPCYKRQSSCRRPGCWAW
jgi:hypothetical protein